MIVIDWNDELGTGNQELSTEFVLRNLSRKAAEASMTLEPQAPDPIHAGMSDG